MAAPRLGRGIHRSRAVAGRAALLREQPSSTLRQANLNPFPSTIGAEMTTIDVRRLNGEQWRSVDQALLDYGVLLFRDQHLTQDEQVVFACHFGEIEVNEPAPDIPMPSYYGEFGTGTPIILEISNIDEHGVHITDPDHPKVRRHSGNEGWHSDSSYRPVTSRASTLTAIEAPARGGATAFADMRAAYDRLTEEEKARLERLDAWHSIAYSNAASGATEVVPADDPTTMTGARHPIVRTHPETGHPSLFIGRHACHIFGLGVYEGQELLRQLLVDACRPPRTWVHSWSTGDLVIWDNRRVLHRALAWDLSYRRVMRHVRIAGT
jgi:alpha-ketoglutarate-dependent taurine dioxygenase